MRQKFYRQLVDTKGHAETTSDQEVAWQAEYRNWAKMIQEKHKVINSIAEGLRHLSTNGYLNAVDNKKDNTLYIAAYAMPLEVFQVVELYPLFDGCEDYVRQKNPTVLFG